jgi:hypothetical protein
MASDRQETFGHRQVELRFVVVLFGFCHSQFFTPRSSQPITRKAAFG